MASGSGKDGSGGSGGTVNQNPYPNIANPIVFTFLNGNSGATGSTLQNYSTTSFNAGYGGNGGTVSTSYGSATGGQGGAGAYTAIAYGPGRILSGNVLSFILGNAGTAGGGIDGGYGGIRITWG